MPVMTVKELSEYYRVTPAAVYKWLAKGLPHDYERIIGKPRRIIINPDDVVTFLGLTDRE